MITLAELSGLSKSQDSKKIKQTNIYQPNSKLMFVGQEHGKKIVINEEIKKAINKYGAWYEGNGDDRIEGIKYQGSWDDKLAKEVRGYPKEFLFVIFTNTAVNKQKEILKGAGNIFDRILRSQKEIGYFKNKRFNSDTLIAFLKEIGGNFLQKSQKEATKKNVASFVDEGEKLMWESGDTAAKEMADKANEYRDRWLLKQPEGVYFVGSDHLKMLKSLSTNQDRGNT